MRLWQLLRHEQKRDEDEDKKWNRAYSVLHNYYATHKSVVFLVNGFGRKYITFSVDWLNISRCISIYPLQTFYFLFEQVRVVVSKL